MVDFGKEYQNLINTVAPQKDADKAWFLSLVDDEKQGVYESERIAAVMRLLRIFRIRPLKLKIQKAKEKIAELKKEDLGAEGYVKTGVLLEEIKGLEQAIDGYKCFFEEPYFARMDLVDNIEGYNSYYIGKKGDGKLEIVDWRAPIARRYYQKSCSVFSFNEYDYKVILRRALRTQNGKVIDFKNEFLSLKEYLTEEELKGKESTNILDPYLREIIQNRKEEPLVQDIIQTIQEKQYEIITSEEKENFVLQGCAGSGKTMVMLHRLSYLMYNDTGIKSRDVLVVTPSNSFNQFIDFLAAVLELEKVKTTTVYDYFIRVLKNEGVDLAEKIDISQEEDERYLSYVYSEKFLLDMQKKLDKVYDNLYGLFTGEECKTFIDDICTECAGQISAYEKIKNASIRVRRAVLGEIKEKAEGGLYYTKPFRTLMNAVLDIQDFFNGTLKSERAKVPEYFYRQLLSFYKSASFARRHTERIVAESRQSLETLKQTIEKEIVDLKRYKQRTGSGETYLYQDRILRREELLQEIAVIAEKVSIVGESNTAFEEFYEYLIGEKTFSAIGKGADFVDVIRYFYREIIKKNKQKYGMTSKKMYKSDAYAICALCARLGRELSPKYSYVFVDEAQDISKGEYALLKRINSRAFFNVFGDVEQNVTPFRGITSWADAFPDFKTYTLNQNYRNTNQIVDFVAEDLGIEMQSIGLDGPEVAQISVRAINGFFKDKKGLKAVICAQSEKDKYARKAYNRLDEKGKVSSSKVNFMSVYESKGLEFTSVVVCTAGMTAHEKYIAYTRALKELAIVKE